MRKKTAALLSYLSLLMAPVAALAQPPSAAPPSTTWPPATSTPTYPAPAPTTAPATAAAPAPAPAASPTYLGSPAAAPVAAPAPAPVPPPAPVNVEAEQSGASAPASTAPAVASEIDERPKGFIPQASLGGSVGLLHMASADVGNVGQLRLSLHGEYFTSDNFLVQGDGSGDHDTRLQGALTFGLTPIDHLEIFGAILGSANRNRRLCSTTNGVETCASEANRTDPELIKSFGDLLLGAKTAYAVSPGFYLGGEFGLRMMSSITGISFSPDSTSLWLSALGMYDLKQATQNVPLRFHLLLGYYIDNSKNLVDYNASNTSAFSRYVSEFAYGISESRFRLGLGVDAPLHELAEGFSLRPIVEYHFEYLTGNSDPVIYSQEHDVGGCGQAGKSACKDNKDLHYLTLGVQAQILHGLTLTVGLDVALRSPGFPYAPALPPWNLLFGAGYAFDMVPRVVRSVPVEKVVVKESANKEGLVAGRVVAANGQPVEGAIVGVTGREHSRVLTDADGSFQSVPLAPGPIELVVSANGFETATVKTEILAGQTANIVLRLTPKAPAARVTGHISDDTGKGVVASIKFAGPQLAESKSDESGNFQAALAPGVYAIRVDADQFLSKEVQLTIAEGRENTISVTLRSRPAIAGVTFQDGKFKLRQAISFVSAGNKPSAELTPGMPHLLDEVVDILVNHSEIRQIRIEAHWDSGMPAAKAQTLTDEQAKTVAKYITDQGIASDRVVPAGMGSKKPAVPNIGKGKLKNRRVEIVVPN